MSAVGKERAEVIRRLKAYRRYQIEAVQEHGRDLWRQAEQRLTARALKLGIIRAERIC